MAYPHPLCQYPKGEGLVRTLASPLIVHLCSCRLATLTDSLGLLGVDPTLVPSDHVIVIGGPIGGDREDVDSHESSTNELMSIREYVCTP